MRDDTLDDRTQSLYRLIQNEPDAHWRVLCVVGMTCIVYDEETGTDRLDPNRDEKVCHRAAEELREWWTGLVERAVKMNNIRQLSVLDRYDADEIDWLALAKHIVEVVYTRWEAPVR